MGLDVTPMTFRRYEKRGLLTPCKADSRRSDRVRYPRDQVVSLLKPKQ